MADRAEQESGINWKAYKEGREAGEEVTELNVNKWQSPPPLQLPM
jgi:hypothetical protein